MTNIVPSIWYVSWWLVLACSTSRALDAPPVPGGVIIDSVQHVEAHREVVRCIAYSPDGSWVASGDDNGTVLLRRSDPFDLRETFDIGTRARSLAFDIHGSRLWIGVSTTPASIVEIHVPTHEMKEARVPGHGGIVSLHVRGRKRGLVYVTSANTIHRFDFGNPMVAEQRIFGGFIDHVAGSPDGEHIAVSSENEVAKQSAPPQKLTVFDGGNAGHVLYQYTDSWEYNYSQHVFADQETIVLCIPAKWESNRPASPGILKRWSRNEALGWQSSDDKPIDIQGLITAISYSQQHGIIWLAVQKPIETPKSVTVHAVDSRTGATLARTEIKIGKRVGSLAAAPITVLASGPSSNQIVAGCWDGRLVVITYDVMPQ